MLSKANQNFNELKKIIQNIFKNFKSNLNST